MRGSGLFKGVSHGTTARGGAPALPNFMGSLLFLWCWITNHQFWGFLSICVEWSGLHFFGGKPRPHSKRRDPSAPQFLGFPGFPSIYARIFCRRNAKFDVGTQVGLYIGDSHASHPTRAEFQLLSNFVGSPVFMPLTQNDQIWHGSQ